MDGLSVAASVAGLMSLAGSICTKLYKYGKAVKGAQDEIARLNRRVSDLYGVLSRIHLMVEVVDEPYGMAARLEHIHECQLVLESIVSSLDHHDASNIKDRKFQTARLNLKWPFQKSKIDSWVADLQRLESTLTLALSADNLSTLLQALSRTNDLQNDVRELKDFVVERQRLENKVAIDTERRALLDLFSDVDPMTTFKSSSTLHYPGTGVWFLDSDEFKNWLETPMSTLWLNGIPGAGKTVLASVILEELQSQAKDGSALAFYFCDYMNPASHEPWNVLAALAKQVAEHDETAFQIFHGFCKSRTKGGKWDSRPTPRELCELILRMASKFESLTIVADGLDECGANTNQVVQLLDSLSRGAKVLLSSRHEQDIVDCLGHYPTISIAARSGDLRLYVLGELETRVLNKQLRLRNPELKDAIATKLIEGAEGMFRWVACQIDYLCQLPSDSHRRKALEQLPPTLNGTYERILKRVNAQSKPVRMVVQRVLRWTAWAVEPLTIDAVREAISIDKSDDSIDADALVEEEDLLRFCGSLIRRTQSSQVLEFGHFTVKEFLLSIDCDEQSDLVPYCLREEVCGTYFADTCITRLLARELTTAQFVPSPTISRRPTIEFEEEHIGDTRVMRSFRRYASCYVAYHVQIAPQPEELTTTLANIFQASKTDSFNTFVQRLLTERLRPLGKEALARNRIPDPKTMKTSVIYGTPLHFASILGLPQLCNVLCRQGLDANKGSILGTPLQCAVMGPPMLIDAADEVPKVVYEKCQEARNAVISILLDAGADTRSRTRRLGQESGETPIDTLWKHSDHSQMNIAASRMLLGAGGLADIGILELDFDPQRRNTGLAAIIDWIQPNNVRAEDHERLAQLKAVTCAGALTDGSTEGASTDSLLHTAIRDGQLQTVASLIDEKGANVNALDGAGQSPLHHAAELGSLEMVEILIEKGADVNLRDTNKRTALHFAASNGTSLPCLIALLHHGASSEAQDRSGRTPLYEAAKTNNVEAIAHYRLHVKDAPKIASICTPTGCSPASEAVFKGHFDCVRELAHLTALKDDRDDQGHGLLQIAIQHPRLDIFQFLLDQGCDPLLRAKDKTTVCHSLFDSALTMFALERNLECLLNHGYDMCAQTQDGLTPLLMFMRSSTDHDLDDSIFMRLVDCMPSISQCDSVGANALHYYCDFGLYDLGPDCGRRLLERGLSLLQPDVNGAVPFFLLIRALGRRETDRRIEINADGRARMLRHAMDLIGGEECLKVREKGRQAFSQVVLTGNRALINEFLALDPDVDIRDDDDLQCSPAEHACGEGINTIALDMILGRSKMLNRRRPDGGTIFSFVDLRDSQHVCRSLLDFGYDVDNRTDNGMTPLHCAAKDGAFQVAEMLIESGADVTARTNEKWTAMHLAADRGSAEILELLAPSVANWEELVSTWFSKGTAGPKMSALHLAAQSELPDGCLFLLNLGVYKDVNLPDGMSRTALHLASSRGHEDLVTALLDKGANPLKMDNNGWTAELMALRKGYKGVAKILKTHMISSTTEKSSSSKSATKLRFCTGLTNAIHQDSIDFCRQAVGLGENIDGGFDGDLDFSPLLGALKSRRTEIAEFLIDSGSSIGCVLPESDSRAGWTSLHLAVAMGLTSIVERLLSSKYDWGNALSQFPLHPIHSAVIEGRLQCMKLLLDHREQLSNGIDMVNAQINDREDWSWYTLSKRNRVRRPMAGTPLHVAAAANDVNCATTLLEAGAMVDSVDADLKTPLAVAAGHKSNRMVRLLLAKGANPNIRTIKLETPLMIAATQNNIELLELLLEGGSEIDDVDTISRNALYLCASTGSARSMGHLLQKGLNFQQADATGLSTLQACFLRGADSAVMSLAFAVSPSFDMCHPQTGNVLHSAASCREFATLKKILRRIPKEKRAEMLNFRSIEDGTPLHQAIYFDDDKVVELFLKHGADPDADCSMYGSALMTASFFGRMAAVKALVRAGAETSYVRDGKVFNAYRAAKRFPEIQRWLVTGRFAEGFPRIGWRAETCGTA